MTDDSTDFQRRYHALQQQFCAELPARLRRIVSSGHDWLATETQAASGDNFQVLVHNLAGTAGSFGFPKITLLCQQIEEAIRKNDPASRKVIRSLLDQLRAFIK